MHSQSYFNIYLAWIVYLPYVRLLNPLLNHTKDFEISNLSTRLGIQHKSEIDGTRGCQVERDMLHTLCRTLIDKRSMRTDKAIQCKILIFIQMHCSDCFLIVFLLSRRINNLAALSSNLVMQSSLTTKISSSISPRSYRILATHLRRLPKSRW